MKLRSYQLSAIEKIEGHIALGTKTLVVKAPGGSGKEQPYSEPILTTKGWKQMGNIQIGDCLYSQNGSQTNVINIFEQGEKDVYTLYFTDGTTARCGLEHLWVIEHNSNQPGKWQTKVLKDFINDANLQRFDKRYNRYYPARRISVPIADAVEFEKKDLPIDPYLFGVLIGDGSFRGNMISVSNSDIKIQKRIIKLLPKNDSIGTMFWTGQTRCDFNIRGFDTKNAIKRMKLFGKYSHEKFIPNDYKHSSIKQRKLLLKGLLDTDGHMFKEREYNEYSTSSEQLSKDVADIARSLGYYVKVTTRIPFYSYNGQKKQGKRSYRIYINFSKKKKSIERIKLTGKEQSRCIYVSEKTHTYLTNDFTVTHNTRLFAEIAKRHEKNGVIIVVSFENLLLQASEELTSLGIDHSVLKAGLENRFDPSKKILIAMAQTFFARIDSLKFDHDFSLVQIDEGHVAWTGERTRVLLNKIKPTTTILYSATPWTGEGFQLAGIEDTVTVSTVKELTEEGFLSPLKYFIPKWSQELRYDKLGMSKGDYLTSDISLLVGTPEYIDLAVKTMVARGYKDKKIAVFTNSIAHAEDMNEALLQAGFRSFAYHSKSPKETSILMDHFKSGKLISPDLFGDGSEPPLCVVSVSRISIGWNVPDLHAGVICRPTKRRSLYYQMALRLTRTAPNKEYGEILDLSGTIERLGFPDEEYSPPKQDDQAQLLQLNKEMAKPAVNYLLSNKNGIETVEFTRKLNLKSIEEMKKIEISPSESPSSELSATFKTTTNLYAAIHIAYEIFFRKYGLGYEKEHIENLYIILSEQLSMLPLYEERLLTIYKRNLQEKVRRGVSLASMSSLIDFLKGTPPFSYAYAIEEQRGKKKDFEVIIETQEDEDVPF